MFRKIAIISSFPAFMLAARFIPFDRLPSTCLFLRFTGLPCPTCGMTRSVMALAHLRLGQAMRFNALGPTFVIMLGALWVCAMYEIRAGASTRVMSWIRAKAAILILAGLVTLMIWGGLRIWLLTR